MAYPGQFHRLVMIGSLYADVFNITLSIVPISGLSVPAVTQDLVDDVSVPVQNFWTATSSTTGIGITGNAILQSIKLNRIGPDGRYVDSAVFEHVYTGGVAGSGPNGLPAQVAMAATIRGLNERQKAGKGRMYFPGNAMTSTLGTDGRMIAGNVANSAQRIHAFLQNIGGVYTSNSIDALPGIASRSGAGAFQVMAQVSVGRVPDTIRSRRSKLAEDPAFFPTLP